MSVSLAKRDRVRLCFEEERTVHQQLKEEYEQKISDNSYQMNILVYKLRQAETVKLDNYTLNNNNNNNNKNNNNNNNKNNKNNNKKKKKNNKNNNNNNNNKNNNNNNKDGTLVVGSSTERDARTGYNEWGSMSLGGIQFDQRTGFDKRERYTPKEKSQDKKPVPAKKPSLTSGHEVTSKFNPEYSKPSSSSVSREPAAPTEAPHPPRLVKSYIRKASLQNRVQEFKTTPRLGRAQSSQNAEGLETYRPELLTSSIHKHTYVL